MCGVARHAKRTDTCPISQVSPVSAAMMPFSSNRATVGVRSPTPPGPQSLPEWTRNSREKPTNDSRAPTGRLRRAGATDRSVTVRCLGGSASRGGRRLRLLTAEIRSKGQARSSPPLAPPGREESGPPHPLRAASRSCAARAVSPHRDRPHATDAKWETSRTRHTASQAQCTTMVPTRLRPRTALS